MRRAAACLVALAGACSPRAPGVAPRGQIVLHLDTDAPLPGGPADGPAPLFDRARVDVFTPGAADPCCTRSFGIDADSVRSGGASIGIVTPPGASGYVARVRLFREQFAQGDVPDEATTVDAAIALPAVHASGIVDVILVLHTDDIGQPADPTSPDAATVASRAPGPSLVGTWPGAARTDCSGAPRAGEACIRGGAFFAGNATGQLTEDALTRYVEAGWHRLAAVRPFFLGAREVTVGEYRASGLPVTPWNGSVAGDRFDDYCTFTANAGKNEALPVTCVEWASARAYCQNLGGDLPTEVQFEYAASGTRGSLFVWGDDEPYCSPGAGDAVFWRSSQKGDFASVFGPCFPGGAGAFQLGPGGPLPAGSGGRDTLATSDAPVVDLAGNVREWMLDEYNAQSESCWTARGVLSDAPCSRPSKSVPGAHTERGGSWLDNAGELEASARSPGNTDSTLGFRCARAAGP